MGEEFALRAEDRRQQLRDVEADCRQRLAEVVRIVAETSAADAEADQRDA